ncbi:hypothetical protein GW17_00024317 [Ensete ventricosum]|nr:hypothetical protein GW17_00024317 [Ensete ventricosum]RZR93416.1 hypothetical protein BHM03_00021924 [Ensete ventricosum]
MIRVTGELDYFSACIRLREPDKSEDKVESYMRIVVCLSIDQGEHRGVEVGVEATMMLVVKGAEEVENIEANSKYQDRAEAKELHKTGIGELLIKLIESEGLRIDAGVLD